MQTWTYLEEIIQEGHSHQYTLLQDHSPISFTEFATLLQEEEDFRTVFIHMLRSSPFQGFFWECKAVTEQDKNSDFECVLINGRAFSRIQADERSFSSYFKVGCTVVDFPNIRGDANLVVPCPQPGASADSYSHLANFVRLAPEHQLHDFWKRVGKVFESSFNNHPVWLSTHGLGVFWLHVRLDSRPKYYHHLPYQHL
ncbi:MAG: hypothetical protein AAFY71_04675 [Bacteroidota bacterium]